MGQEQTQTAVSLSGTELQALLEMIRIAAPRLSMAEQLFFNQLLARFASELEAQAEDIPHIGPAVPLPST